MSRTYFSKQDVIDLLPSKDACLLVRFSKAQMRYIKKGSKELTIPMAELVRFLVDKGINAIESK